MIEKRKEQAEAQREEAEREEERKRLQAAREQEALEERRRREEAARREKERLERELEEQEMEEARQLLEQTRRKKGPGGAAALVKEGEKIDRKALMQEALSERLKEAQASSSAPCPLGYCPGPRAHCLHPTGHVAPHTLLAVTSALCCCTVCSLPSHLACCLQCTGAGAQVVTPSQDNGSSGARTA